MFTYLLIMLCVVCYMEDYIVITEITSKSTAKHAQNNKYTQTGRY